MAVGDVNDDGLDDVLLNGFINSSGERHSGLIYGGSGANELRGQVGADSSDMIYEFNTDTFNNTLLDLDGDGRLDFLFAAGEDTTCATMCGMLFIAYNSSNTVGSRVTVSNNGQIMIRDYDGEITKKKVFTGKDSGQVRVLPHNDNYVVLQQRGKRLAVVGDDGQVKMNISISGVKWKSKNLQIFDLKDNGSLDIVTTKKRVTNNRVRT